MYSNTDFERFFIRYKAEAFPAGELIQKFCFRNNLPYNLFEKWYKDTRDKIVPVHVQGVPVDLKESAPATAVPPASPSLRDIHILVDIRMSNGIHIQQRNLSYDGLKRLVEKLEVLC